jgi:hypothetical protein
MCKEICKEDGGRELVVETFDDALDLIMSNTVPKGVDKITVENTTKKRKLPEYGSEFVRKRKEIFNLMSDVDLSAYDFLENFIISVDAGLPEDDSSIEARIEHADWNNDDLQCDIIGAISTLEGTIAKYIAADGLDTKKASISGYMFEDIQECINRIVDLSHEVELLISLEKAELKLDAASIDLDEAFKKGDMDQANKASVAFNEAFLDREEIKELVENFYTVSTK